MLNQTACSALDNFSRDTPHEAHQQTASLCRHIFDGYIFARVTLYGGPLWTADRSASADHVWVSNRLVAVAAAVRAAARAASNMIG